MCTKCGENRQHIRQVYRMDVRVILNHAEYVWYSQRLRCLRDRTYISNGKTPRQTVERWLVWLGEHEAPEENVRCRWTNSKRVIDLTKDGRTCFRKGQRHPCLLFRRGRKVQKNRVHQCVRPLGQTPAIFQRSLHPKQAC